MNRPVIGITPSQFNNFSGLKLSSDYYQAVVAAGGIPFIVPVVTEDSLLPLYLDRLDGIILSGGLDLDPHLFGENPLPGLGKLDPVRDNFELTLTRLAFNKRIPLLGICKGCQVINVARGGTLYQDIYTQLDGVYKHQQEAPRWYPGHIVKIRNNSCLYDIIGKEKIKVNSRHHQSIKAVGEGFKKVAWSEDGIVEAIEYQGGSKGYFALGIQWHPENMWERQEEALGIFQYFIHICNTSKG